MIDSHDAAAPRNLSLWRAIVIGSTAVILICVLVLAYVFVSRTDAPGRSTVERAQALVGGNSDVEAQRKDVLAVAQQFLLRLNTYGPADLDENNQMPAFRDRVSAVITPKFKVSFDAGVAAAEQSVAQAGVGRTSKIFGAGVSSLDADSARVLVGGSFTVSYPSSEAEGAERVEVEPSPFRIEVSLVKVDDEWLVDDYVPVTGAPSGDTPPVPGEEPTGLPTPSPTDGTPPKGGPSKAPTQPGGAEPTPTPGDTGSKPNDPSPTDQGDG